jgi:hypothetical protein
MLAEGAAVGWLVHLENLLGGVYEADM